MAASTNSRLSAGRKKHQLQSATAAKPGKAKPAPKMDVVAKLHRVPSLDYNRSIVVLCTMLGNRLTATASRVFMERHGLGATDWRILATIAISPGIGGRELAGFTDIDAAAISRSVRSCSARGLLRVTKGQGKGNQKQIFLTPAGAALHDVAIKTAQEREAAMREPFKSADVDKLMDMLHQLLGQIRQLPGAAAVDDE